MYITAAEFRAQVQALDASAIENCIAQLVARSSTATRAGIAFNCLSMDALSNSQRIEIAREVLAERFDAMMDGFETQIEDEEIADLEVQARALAEEEESTSRLRWLWENGLAA